jgi:tRNA (guanine37-N1)-methyltransferase
LKQARAAFAIEIISLVPDLWPSLVAASSGLVGQAFEKGIATLTLNPLRQFGQGVHSKVDDAPYGGGAGMVLSVPPLHRAIELARRRTPGPVLLLSPRGQVFDQALARSLSQQPGMTLICGRYEGVDERVRQYVDADVSLGSFVLSAGDPAAFAVVDAVVRLLPGTLGNPASLVEESFSEADEVEYPQYTRPPSYDGAEVPAVLRSGDHRKIRDYRATVAKSRLPVWG